MSRAEIEAEQGKGDIKLCSTSFPDAKEKRNAYRTKLTRWGIWSRYRKCVGVAAALRAKDYKRKKLEPLRARVSQRVAKRASGNQNASQREPG